MSNRIVPIQFSGRQEARVAAPPTAVRDTLNSLRPFRLFTLTRAQLASGPLTVAGIGYGLVYLREGSSPSERLSLDFLSGDFVDTFAPGDVYRGYFQDFRLSLGAQNGTSYDSGVIRLLILTTPDVDVSHLNGTHDGRIFHETEIIQTPNSTANAPTLATQGVSLEGVTGVRIVVEAESGNTLSGAGTVRLWWYDPAAARWKRNPSQEYDVTASGERDQVFNDLEVLVPYGRIFPELRSVTVSGAATVTAGVVTWGA